MEHFPVSPARRAAGQPRYEPGRPIEDVARDLGLDPVGIAKLASNENAWGPSPAAVAAAGEALREAWLYPDGGAVRLREALAARHGVAPAQIVPGHGSNELLELLGHAYLEPGDEVVFGWPAFVVYRLVALLMEAVPVAVPLRDHVHDLGALRAAVSDRTRLVFLATPNNPTGRANAGRDVEAFARALPRHVLLVVDAAYGEFDPEPPDLGALRREGLPVVELRTFSKAYGLAGLRVGYAVAPAPVAEVLDRVRQPFNLNAVAQAAALAALGDGAHVARVVAATREGRRRLEEGLSALGVETVPSEANFLLARTGRGREVFAALQRRGVIVRPMDGYDLPEWIRVTVGRPEQNERFLAALAAELG